jgi:hypothetical protein
MNDVDFDSDGTLSVEDIADLLGKGHLRLPSPCGTEVKLVGGKLVNVRVPEPKPAPEKIPCEGAVAREAHNDLPLKTNSTAFPELRVKVREIGGRQDKLVEVTEKVFVKFDERITKLERRPTPIWHLGVLQKSCLLLFMMFLIPFGLLCITSIAGHILMALK